MDETGMDGKVRLCLDPVRLNQAVLRQAHRGPTLNDIFTKLNVKYISLKDTSSICHNLKLDKGSSYLTTFACQFGRCRYKRLLFGAVSEGDIFQWKIDEIFKDLPNVFGITDDILVVGYDRNDKDDDDTLWKILQIWRQGNLKINKDKCHLRCTSVHCLVFGGVISRYGVRPQSTENDVPQRKKGTPRISWNNLLFMQILS